MLAGGLLPCNYFTEWKVAGFILIILFCVVPFTRAQFDNFIRSYGNYQLKLKYYST